MNKRWSPFVLYVLVFAAVWLAVASYHVLLSAGQQSFAKLLFPHQVNELVVRSALGIIGVLVVRAFRNMRFRQLHFMEQENLYRSLHDNIPDGVISTDTNGIIKTFNPAAEILFSMDADEMIGRDLAELVPDPYRERHSRHVSEFTGDGSIYLAHEQVIRKSRGKEFEVPMKIRLKAMDVDGETVKFCVVSDLSEHHQISNTLMEERARTRMYLDIAGVILIAIDKNMKVTFINKKGCSLLGVKEDEILGTSWLNFIPLGEREGLEQYVGRIMQGRPVSWEHENAILTSDGEKRLISWTNRVLKDENGIPEGLLASGVDITDTRNAMKAKHTAEENNKSKDRFLDAISHDMRTPLTTIMGISQVLAKRVSRGEATDEELLENIDCILKAGRSLADIVEDVLALSRISAGCLKIHPAQVDLCELIKNKCCGAPEAARTKGLAFINNVADDISPVFTDAKYLSRILNNLIDNAIKYTEEGSVEIDAKEEGPFVSIRVKDSGIGIHEEDQAVIFDRFAQIDSSRIGMGLGLSISKELTQLMGGSILVESKPGQGTTFTLVLPMWTDKTHD